MNLVTASRDAMFVLLALCMTFGLATAARADVMEVTADGAQWVSGAVAVHGRAVRAPDVIAVGTASRLAQTDMTAAGSGPGDVATALPNAMTADLDTRAAIVPARFALKVAELSQRFDLSPTLIEALVWQESRWRETAVSHAGARGLAQLMPGTARDLGVDPDDPMQNLEGGARYLREQLDRFDGDLEKALAAYNAGPERVIRAGGIPNIRETKHYVAAIMGRLASHAYPTTP